MPSDPFVPFAAWLAFLDSYQGRDHRRSCGQECDDYDVACKIPTPPGQAIFTVGDLRALVAAGERLKGFERRAAAACRGEDGGGGEPE